MKICTVIGARPQFIKAAMVSRVIRLTPGIQEIIVHTGQHYDANMSQNIFDELQLPNPHYQLNVGSNSHGKQTGEMLLKIEDILLQEKPDVVLVYGDTNSTLAGALSAVKLHFPVAHVEAGLRSFNRRMPEEINRVVTDHVSSILFSPTTNGYDQLLKEGVSHTQVFNVGDVMYDAVLYYNELNTLRNSILDSLGLKEKAFCLATIHRAENTDSESRLTHIVEALVSYNEVLPVVLPLHPRTHLILKRMGLLDRLAQSIILIEPVGYLDMLALEKSAKLIVTDSGGVQKEAYFNAVPCITLRNETEWMELVRSGWNRLCSPDEPFSLHDYAADESSWPMVQNEFLYGRGDAASRIIDVLKDHF